MSTLLSDRVLRRTELALIGSDGAIARPSGQTVRFQLTPTAALRRAWIVWLALLACPYILFLVLVWRITASDEVSRDMALAQRWFSASTVYLIVAVPAALFLRSHCFKSYWAGMKVTSRAYLTGSVILWASLELGGILSLIGCLMTHSLLPNLFPALVSFMLFASLWPTGAPMVCSNRGNLEDPEGYAEPR